MSNYNIYCDESCHLVSDGEDIMILGGISIPLEQVQTVNKQIRELKVKHNLNTSLEIKWTKVSNGKIGFYKDLVRYFFENPYLSFRGVIATKKRSLDYASFNLTHDSWYYRMYYLLLRHMIQIGNIYKVYVDIKDTQGSEKIHKLQEVLNHSLYDFYNETVERVQLIRSHEVEILQLTDLLIGAISYANRNKNTSSAKVEIIETIKRLSCRNLIYSSSYNETKFNLFVWTPQGGTLHD